MRPPSTAELMKGDRREIPEITGAAPRRGGQETGAAHRRGAWEKGAALQETGAAPLSIVAAVNHTVRGGAGAALSAGRPLMMTPNTERVSGGVRTPTKRPCIGLPAFWTGFSPHSNHRASRRT